MRVVENQTMDSERALYGSCGIMVRNCKFDGPADGESALKESSDVVVEDSYFNLRYPFWHVHGLTIRNSEMTDKCRASMWYSDHIDISGSKLHGIKALRECSKVTITSSGIISPEFGWSVHGLKMTDTTAESEYFLMRSSESHKFHPQYQGRFLAREKRYRQRFRRQRRILSMVFGEPDVHKLHYKRNTASLLLQGLKAHQLRDD